VQPIQRQGGEGRAVAQGLWQRAGKTVTHGADELNTDSAES
jgi:hypothetical protein